MSEEVRRIHAPRREQRPQLPQASGLDLPDALAGEAQAPADRLERLGRFAIEAEAGEEYRPRLVRERPLDRLAHPPRGGGREAGATLGVELVDGAQEPEVPLLDQVGKR